MSVGRACRACTQAKALFTLLLTAALSTFASWWCQGSLLTTGNTSLYLCNHISLLLSRPEMGGKQACACARSAASASRRDSSYESYATRWQMVTAAAPLSRNNTASGSPTVLLSPITTACSGSCTVVGDLWVDWDTQAMPTTTAMVLALRCTVIAFTSMSTVSHLFVMDWYVAALQQLNTRKRWAG